MIKNRKALIIAQGVVTDKEYERMLAVAKQELQEGNLQGIPPAYVTFGQRPVMTQDNEDSSFTKC